MKRKMISVAAVLAGMFLLFAFAKPATNGYAVGDKARDFKLKNVDGKMVSLSDYKDAKGFIVTFTCNHCPFAIAYQDRIIALHKKYAAKGYPVVAINSNSPDVEPVDSYDNMIVRAKEKQFTFAYLFDETQDIAKAYGAMRTPHVYILSKKNNEFVGKRAHLGDSFFGGIGI